MAGLEEETSVVILGNALRLFKDAKLLLKNERYPSAAALAILSMEEFGKFLSYIGVSLGSSKLEKRLHIKHQSSFSGFFLRASFLVSILEHFEIAPEFRLSEKGAMKIPLDTEQEERVSPYLYLRENEMDLDVFEQILGSTSMQRGLHIFSRVYSGDLNAFRNKCFRVYPLSTRTEKNKPFWGRNPGKYLP